MTVKEMNMSLSKLTSAIAVLAFLAAPAHADPKDMDHSTMDHATMDHSAEPAASMDHDTMDHDTMDHSDMEHSDMNHGEMDHSNMDHGTMDHSSMDHSNHDMSDMPTEAMPAQIGASTITAKVNGLVCDFCAQALRKVFKKEDAVDDIVVDLDSGEVVIALNSGATLDDDRVKKLIRKSGYSLVSIERNTGQ